MGGDSTPYAVVGRSTGLAAGDDRRAVGPLNTSLISGWAKCDDTSASAAVGADSRIDKSRAGRAERTELWVRAALS